MNASNRRHSLSRRSFLATGTTGAFAAVTARSSMAAAATDRRARARVLRMAHLTDIHVQPELDAAAGMAAAIRQAQAEKPDVVFFGGDLIMDALGADKDRALLQWELWHKVISAELKTDVVYAIGNHDVWAWARHDDTAAAGDRHFGKAMVLEQLALVERYHSFDRAGWHFVVLDSTHHDPSSKRGYHACLDEEQFAWLGRDLAGTPATTPVCVLSHIPLVSVCSFFDGENEKSGDWVIPGAWTHIDARRTKDLFHRHPNVRVCLSGHVHLVDDVNYLGVRYCCNGAVSGNWWKGAYQEFGPAYAIVDFFDDGTVDNRLVHYSS